MEGIHLLYLEINKIFSLSCQPICNSATQLSVASCTSAKLNRTGFVGDHYSFNIS